MRRAWLVQGLALVVAVAGWGLSYGAQQHLRAHGAAEPDVNMLFVPPPALVKALAAGQENLAADGLWMGFLQYFGDRVVKDHKVVNVAPMLNLITDLDPHFYYAYFLGSWALGDSGQGDDAVALMRKAGANNPQEWNYPYLEGFMHFLFRKDYPAAIEALERAGRMPGADRFCWTMAARVRQRLGQDQDALSIWKAMEANAKDRFTKEIAHRNVLRIEAEMAGQRPRAFPVRVEGDAPASAPAQGDAGASSGGGARLGGAASAPASARP